MFTEKIASSHIDKRTEVSLATRQELYRGSSGDSKFFEFEPAVVLDVIVDQNHSIFKAVGGNSVSPKIDPDNHPGTPSKTDIDYSWIGRILVRMVNSEKGKGVDSLSWAIPIGGIQELPLVNELVYVVKYLDQIYYQRLNTRNFVNNNADFRYEKKYGLNQGVGEFGPVSYTRNSSLSDPLSDYRGSLGRYFKANDDIRSVRRNEGDYVIESRFGQSIRFNGFTGDANVDSAGLYASYKDGTGNPCIFIRNRQRNLNGSDNAEKNVGGTISEDVNADGSSFQITSGKYISQWDKDTVKIKPFQTGNYESKYFSPSGSTSFKYPILNGDQVLIQSDRIIISAKKNEMFLCSKYRFSIFTDSEFTVDSEKQVVISTKQHFHVNSPYIFLGDYAANEQAIILGTDAAKWLYELIEWLKTHTHIYKHNHPRTGAASPEKTQVTPEIKELMRLQDLIPTLVSDRVFTSGRGKGTGSEVRQTNNPPINISKIPKG